MTGANHVGLSVSRGRAIKWLAANPAKALGIVDWAWIDRGLMWDRREAPDPLARTIAILICGER